MYTLFYKNLLESKGELWKSGVLVLEVTFKRNLGILEFLFLEVAVLYIAAASWVKVASWVGVAS